MQNTQSIKAAVIQFQHQAGDKKYNLLMMEKFIGQAAVEGVEIIVLTTNSTVYHRLLACAEAQRCGR